MTKYDWSNVPSHIKCIVTEPNEGLVLAMTEKPECFDFGWQGSGDWFVLELTPFKGNWQDSLEERPND